MLITENLLRRMIQHTLTLKILKENDENDENADKISDFKYCINKIEGFNNKLKELNNLKNVINSEKLLGNIIFEMLLTCLTVKSFFNEGSKEWHKPFATALDVDITDKNVKKLTELINHYLFRKCESLKIDDVKSESKKIKEEIKKIFIALGLRYHVHFDNNKGNETKTGTQIGKAKKSLAITKILETFQKDNTLDKFIAYCKEILNQFNKKMPTVSSEELKPEEDTSKDKVKRSLLELDIKTIVLDLFHSLGNADNNQKIKVLKEIKKIYDENNSYFQVTASSQQYNLTDGVLSFYNMINDKDTGTDVLLNWAEYFTGTFYNVFVDRIDSYKNEGADLNLLKELIKKFFEKCKSKKII